MTKTGVFATEKEKQMLRDALRTPVMFISGGQRLGTDPVKLCHELALKHGLPEINGYYGIIETGEFVKA